LDQAAQGPGVSHPGAGADPPLDRGSVVTVGTFDGVHLGHQEVLREVARRADQAGRRSIVVTFDPHPLRIVRPEAAPPLLTTPQERKLLLAATGVRHAAVLHFTPALQQYSARRFVEQILIGGLALRELVLGHDHAFGRGREGSLETMRETGRELGFAVDVVEPVQLGEGPISSTRVRSALSSGDIDEARRLLGRSYSLVGTVIAGERRGRTLGFPTANLLLDHPDKLLPAPGIYAVRGAFRRECHPGLLHLGPRPVFPGSPPTIELYVMDWAGDIYGERVEVELVARLRDVLPFQSVNALIDQMRRDEEAGRMILAERERGR
jgi:riboflavin kinase / FMN adenylyltransferase